MDCRASVLPLGGISSLFGASSTQACMPGQIWSGMMDSGWPFSIFQAKISLFTFQKTIIGGTVRRNLYIPYRPTTYIV